MCSITEKEKVGDGHNFCFWMKRQLFVLSPKEEKGIRTEKLPKIRYAFCFFNWRHWAEILENMKVGKI